MYIFMKSYTYTFLIVAMSVAPAIVKNLCLLMTPKVLIIFSFKKLLEVMRRSCSFWWEVARSNCGKFQDVLFGTELFHDNKKTTHLHNNIFSAEKEHSLLCSGDSPKIVKLFCRLLNLKLYWDSKKCPWSNKTESVSILIRHIEELLWSWENRTVWRILKQRCQIQEEHPCSDSESSLWLRLVTVNSPWI